MAIQKIIDPRPSWSPFHLLRFLIATIPKLYTRLKPFNQPFRIGIDFGIIHLGANSLIRTTVHFSKCGVNACRLEQAARENTVLATETVQIIYAPMMPSLFSIEPALIETKDRMIKAYEINVLNHAGLKHALTIWWAMA
jgi:hypothetical protein